MRSPFNLAHRFALICVLQLVSSFAAELGHAQTRKPTANEVAAIRDCATKNKDNYKGLLDTLDADQAAKAQAMQRAWMAYRDPPCEFYYDKIQGVVATTM